MAQYIPKVSYTADTNGGLPIGRYEEVIQEETIWEDDPMDELEAEDNRPKSSPFNLDEWEMDQGRRLMRMKGDDSQGCSLDFADAFAASFRQCPEIEQPCSDPRREDFFRTMLESPDFQNLHKSTASNLMASDMSAVQIAERFRQMKVADEKRHNSKQHKNDSPEDQQMADEIACISAVGKAVRDATEQVEEMEAMCRAYGLDPGAGGNVGMENIRKQLKEVKQNSNLKRILQLAGRYRLTAQATQRNKVKHGFDDMVGVEYGNEIGRLLPSELAKLVDDDLGDDTMRRYAERQLMIRQYEGREPQAKGPVVVCIDESGSMSGERICQAKAFALAMMWIAKKQKRGCVLASFSAGPHCLFINEESKDVGKWLVHFFNGGTDLIVPCSTIPDMWTSLTKKHQGKTDMIIVTDAVLDVRDFLRNRFLKWKKEQDVKLQTIVIGGKGDSMKCISDQIHEVNCISADGDETLAAFSI